MHTKLLLYCYSLPSEHGAYVVLSFWIPVLGGQAQTETSFCMYVLQYLVPFDFALRLVSETRFLQEWAASCLSFSINLLCHVVCTIVEKYLMSKMSF